MEPANPYPKRTVRTASCADAGRAGWPRAAVSSPSNPPRVHPARHPLTTRSGPVPSSPRTREDRSADSMRTAPAPLAPPTEIHPADRARVHPPSGRKLPLDPRERRTNPVPEVTDPGKFPGPPITRSFLQTRYRMGTVPPAASVASPLRRWHGPARGTTQL